MVQRSFSPFTDSRPSNPPPRGFMISASTLHPGSPLYFLFARQNTIKRVCRHNSTHFRATSSGSLPCSSNGTTSASSPQDLTRYTSTRAGYTSQQSSNTALLLVFFFHASTPSAPVPPAPISAPSFVHCSTPPSASSSCPRAKRIYYTSGLAMFTHADIWYLRRG